MSYRKTFTEAYDQVKIGLKEQDTDHEVSMARGQLEAIADKALQLSSMLKEKPEMGNPLEAWVQSKLTRAKDDITAVHDYMAYTPDNAMEEVEEGLVKEEDAYDNERFIIIGGKAKIDGGNTPDKKDHVYAPDAKTALQLHKQGKKVYKEELEEGFASNLIVKAKEIAKKLSGNMTKAYDEIEKLAKGLSKDPEVAVELRKQNEETDRPKPSNPNPKEIDEKFQDGFAVRFFDPSNKKRFAAAFKTKKDAEDKAAQLKKDGLKDITITKHNLNFKESDIYGSDLMGKISDSQLANIKKTWAKKTPKDVTQGIRDMIKKMDTPTKLAIQFADINILSKLVKEDISKFVNDGEE
jgi:hypothetical protein